jgi:hypothetical protein
MPETRILQALVVDVLHRRAKMIPATIWLPIHLQHRNISNITTWEWNLRKKMAKKSDGFTKVTF